MRISAAIYVIAISSLPAVAEDFALPFPLTDITAFPETALLTHSAEVEIPQGRHRVILPYTGLSFGHDEAKIQLPDGLAFLNQNYSSVSGLDAEEFYTPAQRDAREAVEQAEQALEAENAKLLIAQDRLNALQAQKDFLATMSGANLTTLSGQDMRDMSRGLGQEMASILAEITSTQADIKALQKPVEDAQGKLDALRLIYSALNPPMDGDPVVVVEVRADAPVKGVVRQQGTSDDLGWAMSYDVRLNTTGAAPLIIERTVDFWSEEFSLVNVNLTLSTAEPDGQLGPYALGTRLARIYEPAPPPNLVLSESADGGLAEPVIEPEIIASASSDGIVTTYKVPFPVSTLAEHPLLIPLPSIELAAEKLILAHPRYDAHAFMRVTTQNTSGEPLLGGDARLFRDGQLIGKSRLRETVPGQEMTFDFGPMKQIRLDHVFVKRETGDKGLVSRSDTRSETMAFTVHNLMDSAQDVRVLYALPYSEQEDLRVRTRMSIQPDEMDLDEKRGNSAWNMSLAPGQKRRVQIEVSMDWPEGWELSWSP